MRYSATESVESLLRASPRISLSPAEDSQPINPLACPSSETAGGGAHVAAFRRAVSTHPVLGRQFLINLQRSHGNAYTRQVLNVARKDENGQADPGRHLESAIERSKGGGQALDSGVRPKMESAFGADFSGVRVHTDSESDSLNRDVSARAFTIGQDIYFRQGEYRPESAQGRELLAHELTHVVQQNGAGMRFQLTVSQPEDPEEVEAEHVAKNVTRMLDLGLEEKGGPAVARAIAPATASADKGCPCGGAGHDGGACPKCEVQPAEHGEHNQEGIRPGGIHRFPALAIRRLDQDLPYIGPLESYLNPLNQAARLVMPGLSPAQKSLLDGIFGASLSTSIIRLNQNSTLGMGNCYRTTGNIINMPGTTIDDSHLIHEAAHVWQSQNTVFGVGYAISALKAQAIAQVLGGDWQKAYDYSGVEKYQIPWRYWNAEQQAHWIQDHRTLPSGWMLQGLLPDLGGVESTGL